MSATIIKQRSFHTGKRYALSYTFKDNPHSGFSFTCDKHGNVAELKPAALANYEKCRNGTHAVDFQGIETHEWHYFEPAELRCHCGCIVVLDHFTNTCDACHADYNMSGQLLAPRDQWGEETGEHWTDCV